MTNIECNHRKSWIYQNICNNKINENFSRLLLKNSKKKLYNIRKENEKSVLHWGQRKLLLSEIEFLTNYSRIGDTVLYIGAAPGTHIKLLSTLFQSLKFILYDINNFKIRESTNIKIKQEIFTNQTAQLYKEYDNLLLISDIRTRKGDIVENSDVLFDMNTQKEWVEIIKPKYSILKFRLPWNWNKKDEKKETYYFKGLIYLPVWGPQSTTESRLVVSKNFLYKMWNHEEYESKMFYFNLVTRVQKYSHNIQNIDGLDDCYDCFCEYYILKKYLKNYLKIKENIVDGVRNLIIKISDCLTFNKYNLKTYYIKKYLKLKNNN